MNEGRWMSLADASKALAVTVDALRHRVRKGELTSRRGNDGRVQVLVGGEPAASLEQPEANAEIALLREELADASSRAARAEGELAGLREALARADTALGQARDNLAEARRELARSPQRMAGATAGGGAAAVE
jgi:chromosome segregation ATPase